jgi:hypothetical protein
VDVDKKIRQNKQKQGERLGAKSPCPKEEEGSEVIEQVHRCLAS